MSCTGVRSSPTRTASVTQSRTAEKSSSSRRPPPAAHTSATGVPWTTQSPGLRCSATTAPASAAAPTTGWASTPVRKPVPLPATGTASRGGAGAEWLSADSSICSRLASALRRASLSTEPSSVSTRMSRTRCPRNSTNVITLITASRKPTVTEICGTNTVPPLSLSRTVRSTVNA